MTVYNRSLAVVFVVQQKRRSLAPLQPRESLSSSSPAAGIELEFWPHQFVPALAATVYTLRVSILTIPNCWLPPD